MVFRCVVSLVIHTTSQINSCFGIGTDLLFVSIHVVCDQDYYRGVLCYGSVRYLKRAPDPFLSMNFLAI
jgi:hypothetical protein